MHAVRNIQENSLIQDSVKWTLLLDFINAFNSIDREVMLSEVRTRLPGLSAWLQYCFSSPSSLLFGVHQIESCCGVQQGDPFGPLVFALTHHPIIQRITKQVPNLLANVWYMDDGRLCMLCGAAEDLQSILAIIEELGSYRELYLKGRGT